MCLTYFGYSGRWQLLLMLILISRLIFRIFFITLNTKYNLDHCLKGSNMHFFFTFTVPQVEENGTAYSFFFSITNVVKLNKSGTQMCNL